MAGGSERSDGNSLVLAHCGLYSLSISFGTPIPQPTQQLVRSLITGRCWKYSLSGVNMDSLMMLNDMDRSEVKGNESCWCGGDGSHISCTNSKYLAGRLPAAWRCSMPLIGR